MTEREHDMRYYVEGATGDMGHSTSVFDPHMHEKAAAINDSTADIAMADRTGFKLADQVAERPWLAFGAAVLAGYLLSRIGGTTQPDTGAPDRSYHYRPGHQPGKPALRAANQIQARYALAHDPQTRVNAQATRQAGDELNLIKSAAFAAIGNAVSSTFKDTFAQAKHELTKPRSEELPTQAGNTGRATDDTGSGAADNLDHYELKGSFATGLADKPLVEATNVREGSFATGLADPELNAADQPDPADVDVIDHTEVQGSFATGLAAKPLVEGSNVREGNFATKDADQISDEDWLRRNLTKE